MTQLSTPKLPEVLAGELAAEIVSLRLSAGEELPSEQLLVNQYGVSKVVVRTALQYLAIGGLVQIRHGRRTVVLPEHEWDVLSELVQDAFHRVGRAVDILQGLYGVRAKLEPFAAWCAALNASDLERLRIGRIADEMEALRPVAEELEALLKLDRELHATIVQASGNLVLSSTMRALASVVMSAWQMTLVDVGDFDVLVAQHRAIADAILAADPIAAQSATEYHMAWAIERDGRERLQEEPAPS